MHSKAILTIIVGIIVIGVTQVSFAEDNTKERFQKISYIAVDVEKFEQPTSTYNYHEITITGKIVDYHRGENFIIIIKSPSESEEEITTIASKKGKIYTLLYITQDSQIGVHQVILKFRNVEIATTSFEILENQ